MTHPVDCPPAKLCASAVKKPFAALRLRDSNKNGPATGPVRQLPLQSPEQTECNSKNETESTIYKKAPLTTLISQREHGETDEQRTHAKKAKWYHSNKIRRKIPGARTDKGFTRITGSPGSPLTE